MDDSCVSSLCKSKVGWEWLKKEEDREFQASLGYKMRSSFKITHQDISPDCFPILQKRAAKSHLLHKQKEYFTTTFFFLCDSKLYQNSKR